MLRTIGISDTVLGTGQLFLNVLAALFRLGASRLRLDDVGKLNNKVELAGTGLLVDSVQQIKFSDQAL